MPSISNAIKLLICISLVILQLTETTAQAVYREGNPPSMNTKLSHEIPTESMPQLDYNKLINEDNLDKLNNEPLRFGYLHKVNLSLDNSGKWTTLENGDKIWQLKIYAPNAQL